MTNSSINNQQKGVEILIQGTVQGVGFRPFVYNLANRLKIAGSVSNTSKGVVIQATGSEKNLHSFLVALKSDTPPLADILSFDTKEIRFSETPTQFTILFSKAGDTASAIIPPDISTCDDCYADLTDPDNFRYKYPFTNCTNCGPRFTIVKSIPYDRAKTSMHEFTMCKVCQDEYEDPANRRFHAQPNACPACGPHLNWHDRYGNTIPCEDPVTEAVAALKNNKVLAIRGLGGFHLAVNGHSEEAIQTLRDRKGRPAKPLAVMVPNLTTAHRLAHLEKEDEKLLLSPEHPIVLLTKKESAALPENLAPNVRDIGIMLPYTPLHHLLFFDENCPDVLVMTSGNLSGIPICTDNNDGIAKLGSLVDNFLLHNREIVTRVDDSVVKVTNSVPRTYRRARGYVPSPIVVPWELPQLIACGGGLKSTFTLARKKTLFPSQHIGDLDNVESYDFYLESIAHLKKVFEIKPVAVACDLHPDYMSTRYAQELGLPLYKIQHHHAHAVSVMAEHGIESPVLAIVLDGTGYGTDKTSWGGEILHCSLTEADRLGHLSPIQLPGGDIAAYQPWRVALSLIHNAGLDEKFPDFSAAIDRAKRQMIHTMIENDFNCPVSSSCGRLFDGVSSLLEIQHNNSYEGQAAIELENLAWKSATTSWTDDLSLYMNKTHSRPIMDKTGSWEIASADFIKMILDLIEKGTTVSAIALKFHFMVIQQFTELAANLAEETGIRRVVLSGGCFQNSLLLQGFIYALTQRGLEPLTSSKIPVNDGGISLGQAVIGGLRHVYSTTNASNKG